MSTPIIDIKIRLQGRIVIDDGCWLWQGAIDEDGYGALSVGNKKVRAHRAAYEAYVGRIPPGLQIDHLCRRTGCINPAHLEPVTAQENVRRSMSPCAANARKTHCASGHPFDEKNTYTPPKEPGKRKCRTCMTEAQRRHRANS